MTIGKRLGLMVFIVSQLMVILFTGWIIRIGKPEMITVLLGFQTSILTVVWVTKASSNFAKGGKK